MIVVYGEVVITEDTILIREFEVEGPWNNGFDALEWAQNRLNEIIHDVRERDVI